MTTRTPVNFNVILASIIVFIVSFFVFTFSMRYYPTTDSLPNNYIAFNLLFEGRIDLSNYEDILINRDLIGIAVKNSEGKLFSKTSPLVGILSAPTFWLINQYYGVSYLTEKEVVNTYYNQYVGKISASIYLSLSVLFIFLLLYRLSKNIKFTLFSTIIYVFGTNIFNTAAQANWQHAISLFLITLFLLIFAGNEKKSAYVLITTGIISGLFSQLRISNTFYIIFPILFFLFSTKKEVKKLTIYLCSTAITYFLISNMLQRFGVPFGYGGELTLSLKEFTLLTSIKNLTSLLFSFNHGLFTFSPVLLLVIPSILLLFKKSRKNDKERHFLLLLLPVLLTYLLFSSIWWMWTGGISLNARLLSEAVPIFVLLANYSIKYYWEKSLFWAFTLPLFLISFYTNYLTTFAFDYEWHDKYIIKGHHNQFRNAWYSHPPLLVLLAKRNYIFYEKIYRKDGYIYSDKFVFRPSIKYANIVKLFSSKEEVLRIR